MLHFFFPPPPNIMPFADPHPFFFHTCKAPPFPFPEQSRSQAPFCWFPTMHRPFFLPGRRLACNAQPPISRPFLSRRLPDIGPHRASDGTPPFSQRQLRRPAASTRLFSTPFREAGERNPLKDPSRFETNRAGKEDGTGPLRPEEVLKDFFLKLPRQSQTARKGTRRGRRAFFPTGTDSGTSKNSPTE